MKREYLIGFVAMIFIAMLALALFNRHTIQDVAQETMHEITTADMWKQSAYAPGQVGLTQVAFPSAPAIFAGAEKPTLIKQMGCEMVQVGGGKVKITGVMGGSWADKAKLKAGDIILSFNGKQFDGLKGFQAMVAAVAPEKDYKIKYMRGANIKKGLVTIGEGEMEGFTPIPVPK
ncbi:MAG: PDZ domain-containing protein [Candidatus Omnitrophica bacterium]|nr:PDZ domain-containing protein [Candidatus Omnitrophota bacterium]